MHVRDWDIVDFAHFRELVAAAAGNRERARAAFNELLEAMGRGVAGVTALPQPVCVPIIDLDQSAQERAEGTSRAIGLVLGTQAPVDEEIPHPTTSFWLTLGRRKAAPQEPLNSVKESELDPILVGESLELAGRDAVYLGRDELDVGVLFLGASGSGKTVLASNLLVQIAERVSSGKLSAAIWVIDPVGRLGEHWLSTASDRVLEHTYFIDPSRPNHGLNPLILPPAKDETDYLLLAKERTSAVTRMIKEASRLDTGQVQWGHRLRRIIRLILMDLYNRGLERPEKAVFTFGDVMRVVDVVGKEEELTLLANEMGLSKDLVAALGGYDKEVRDEARHKIERFVEPIIRSIVCSNTNVPFTELDRPGNVIFIDFRQFLHVPDDIATMMASAIMNIYSAELANKHTTSKPFQTYLVVDEFHRTSDILSFRDILATARNINLSVWLIYQGARQIDDETLHEEVFSNTRTKFVFTVGDNLAASLKADLNIALGKQMAENLQRLNSYQFYLLRSGQNALQSASLIKSIFPKSTRLLEDAMIMMERKGLPPALLAGRDRGEYVWATPTKHYQPSVAEIAAIVQQIPQAMRQMAEELERIKTNAEQALWGTEDMVRRLNRWR